MNNKSDVRDTTNRQIAHPVPRISTMQKGALPKRQLLQAVLSRPMRVAMLGVVLLVVVLIAAATAIAIA